MSVSKSIVCLANSRKLSGRCVAGREIVDGYVGAWVRPVSSRPDQEVSPLERQYEDGREPRLLDVIDVPLLEACPDSYHSENWLLDPESYWASTSYVRPDDLDVFLDPEQLLWIDGSSTRLGLNDKISLRRAISLRSSLKFIKVPDVRLRVLDDWHKRRVQAQFRHARTSYCLWVTDPEYENRFLRKANGEYALGTCYLTISIGEPYQGNVYKLVAAIIEAT